MIEENGHWYERCGDCGGAVKEQRKTRSRKICDECWERRGWLVDNAARLPKAEFQQIQRAMAFHTGTAKRKIIKLQAEIAALKSSKEGGK